MYKSNLNIFQIMSSRFCMSPSCWRQSKLWFHQFRQFAVVNAHYLSIDYLGLLGKRLQYGQFKVGVEKNFVLVFCQKRDQLFTYLLYLG